MTEYIPQEIVNRQAEKLRDSQIRPPNCIGRIETRVLIICDIDHELQYSLMPAKIEVNTEVKGKNDDRS